MTWLAIESSTLVASVAVGEGAMVMSEASSLTRLTHSQRLLPMIDQALHMAGLAMENVQSLIVASGPGSFTGLRIGLATAKGLAHARHLPVYGVSALEALAWQQPEGKVVPLLDARRGQVYAAVYQRTPASLEVIEPPVAIALQDMLSGLAGDSYRFVGEGSQLHREQIAASCPQATFADTIHDWPRASSLAMVLHSQERPPTPLEALSPLYLRASAAERMLVAKEER